MNLRQIKSKIKSISNVGQITRAMELVSAVKMKKTQTQAIEGKPYRVSLEETSNADNPLTICLDYSLIKSKALKKPRLAIIISSNKGLCGVFNFNLFRFLNEQIKTVNDYEFVVMGIKAQQFIFHWGGKIVADFSLELPFINNTTAIYQLMSERFLKGDNSAIELYYNQFVSTLVSKPTKKNLLPLRFDGFEDKSDKDTEVKVKDYLIEPKKTTVLNGLFNFYLESEIRGAIQESEAAEHSARMVAMKNATDNSNELVDQLTLMRNRVRQETITNELLDMNTARLVVS